MRKKAVIIGVSGQDGAYLARFLLEKGYSVVGTSRDVEGNIFYNLSELNILKYVALESLDIVDFKGVLEVILKHKPDEIYNLGGQSSVSLSFIQPRGTLESIAVGTLNILEAIRLSGHPCRLYNAGSGEMFGEVDGDPATESSPFSPVSPYAVAKLAAYWHVQNYRIAYNMYCCTGILFNHESPLRPLRFVSQKIVSSAVSIANGKEERLRLGDLAIVRDWGWAPEYVEAMWLMLQQDHPSDYVIATGKSHSLADFVDYTFGYFGLKWQDYVEVDSSLFRPTDVKYSFANPAHALNSLEWQAELDLEKIIKKMIEFKLQKGSLHDQ